MSQTWDCDWKWGWDWGPFFSFFYLLFFFFCPWLGNNLCLCFGSDEIWVLIRLHKHLNIYTSERSQSGFLISNRIESINEFRLAIGRSLEYQRWNVSISRLQIPFFSGSGSGSHLNILIIDDSLVFAGLLLLRIYSSSSQQFLIIDNGVMKTILKSQQRQTHPKSVIKHLFSASASVCVFRLMEMLKLVNMSAVRRISLPLH